MGKDIPSRLTDEEVGQEVVNRFMMVHTEDSWQKLQTICVMYQKLMGLVNGEVQPDNQDTMNSHDVLLPGQLYGMVLKENLEVMMEKVRGLIYKQIRKDPEKGTAKYSVEDFFQDIKLLDDHIKGCADVAKKMGNFLATGNVHSRNGLDLMQKSGYTVVADKLNHARYSSHFAAIHRGQYFTEMKTTTVRKLLPETWGFLCPVHTPDGSPCGLLNHLAHLCKAVIDPPAPDAPKAVARVLAGLGMDVLLPGGAERPSMYDQSGMAWVLLDGCPIGRIDLPKLGLAEMTLRTAKVNGKDGVPKDLEIVCITKDWGNLFVGLYLFLGPSRLIRPVRSIKNDTVEWIGPLEQLFLNICVLPEEKSKADDALAAIAAGDSKATIAVPEQLPVKYSHEELYPTSVFSTLAGFTPFSNHNQSPRNMYQCQMLKQTMGTPYHNHERRVDNKVFYLQSPQVPLVSTTLYRQVNANSHPSGTNAVVAVITYTGYDIEDAMIINKASFERGFGHGSVFKSKVIDCADSKLPVDLQKACKFTNIKRDINGDVVRRFCEDLDDDGFPKIGTQLSKGDPMCCSVNHEGHEHIHRYNDEEKAYVEHVSLVNGEEIDGAPSCRRLILRLRLPRNPVVGDKFSSRHGQKGVMSFLWPQEDVPFSESGITPDILFNPHGFPSRMTIGMLIESIAAKAAACEGNIQADGTTFRDYHKTYSEKDENNEGDPFLQKAQNQRRHGRKPLASDYFGPTLAKHGFQHLGTEKMYSGIHGTEMEAEIFLGVIYYQRLRHLVSDKFQVRARGPNDRVTQQPVQGRKKHGGIRFGEMERDSLLAHGAAYLLHDRLMRCSDYDVAYVCPLCGSILTPQANFRADNIYGLKDEAFSTPGEPWICPPCTRKTGRLIRCHPMPVPWVFRYFVCEMGAMNVKVDIRLADRARQASLSSVKTLTDTR
jgi:DNA-directed RNA polymerase I subunit RPA2